MAEQGNIVNEIDSGKTSEDSPRVPDLEEQERQIPEAGETARTNVSEDSPRVPDSQEQERRIPEAGETFTAKTPLLSPEGPNSDIEIPEEKQEQEQSTCYRFMDTFFKIFCPNSFGQETTWII